MSINGRLFFEEKPVHLVEFGFVHFLVYIYLFRSFNYWVDACVTLMTNRKLCTRETQQERGSEKERENETRNAKKSKYTILKLESYRLISFSQPC